MIQYCWYVQVLQTSNQVSFLLIGGPTLLFTCFCPNYAFPTHWLLVLELLAVPVYVTSYQLTATQL